MTDGFRDMVQLTNINGLENLDIDQTLCRTFWGCRNLKEVNLSGVKSTSGNGNCDNAFTGCDSLTDIYTPTSGLKADIILPGNKWYNVSNENDNNIYSKFNKYTFTGSVHLRKLIDYNITYDLDGGSAEGNPTSYNALTPNFTLNNPTRE